MDTEGPCNDPSQSDLLSTWEEVDTAMDKLFDIKFRCKYPDSSGGTFKIGWFFLTWTGFVTNPRGRDFGYHKVRDHYLARWGHLMKKYSDEQCWHYHHPNENGIGNIWGTDWSVCKEYEKIISRQIIEREWFPVCYRSGGTFMDSVSSKWVDAWFPIDYSNRAPLKVNGLVDWSDGEEEWKLYRPDLENFQKPGNGNRHMARCMDLNTWIYKLDEGEIEKAFIRADSGQPAILACFDHDYRDIVSTIDNMRETLNRIAKRYPDVSWNYAGPVKAIQNYFQYQEPKNKLCLSAKMNGNKLSITSSIPIFQRIPWIAVNTVNNEYLHIENDIIQESSKSWVWYFPESMRSQRIGIGASTQLGESSCCIMDM